MTISYFPVITDIHTYGLLARIKLAPLSKPWQRDYRLQKKTPDAALHLKATGKVAILAPALVAEPAHIVDRLVL